MADEHGTARALKLAQKFVEQEHHARCGTQTGRECDCYHTTRHEWIVAHALVASAAREQTLLADRLAAVQGVLDLMETAGTLHVEPDAIAPHADGDSCWFRDANEMGAYPLTAYQILDRIDARAALAADAPAPEETQT